MTIAIALLLGAASAATPSPAPSPSPAAAASPVVERLQWSRAVDGEEPVTAIDIRNDFGDIRARNAGDRVLDVSMVVQRLDPSGQRVGFSVERRGGTIALVVAYPPGRVKDQAAHPAKDSYDRVDLVVFVPAGVALRAHTLRGRVEAKGLKGDVDAFTEDGPIFVTTSGTTTARTASGTITALPGAATLAAPGPPLILESDSGTIEVTLSGQPSPELRVETAGEIDTALALTRTRLGDRNRAVSAADAKAVRLLLIGSRTGTVRIVRDDP